MLKPSPIDRACAGFRLRFEGEPMLVVRAPGRVNLIGEHTDYNDGFVLPAAIDRDTVIALRPRPDTRLRIHSLNLGSAAEIDLDRLAAGASSGWSRYAVGVAALLKEGGLVLQGWDGVVASNLPIGAGLSSSAAFELALARTFTALAGEAWDPVAAARLCQRAESEWAGVHCGIMDQLAVACGRADHALLIDCRTLEMRPAPLDPALRIVVLDTGKQRSLAASAYNQRRSECNAAARACGRASLRDVSPAELEEAVQSMDAVQRRRARHVLSENARTLDFFNALSLTDLGAAGVRMRESHASLRDDYEASCPELDAIVEIAAAQPGCAGARMTGAGFGGCAVALVEADALESFMESVSATYAARTGFASALHPCRAVNGAEIVEDRR